MDQKTIIVKGKAKNNFELSIVGQPFQKTSSLPICYLYAEGQTGDYRNTLIKFNVIAIIDMKGGQKTRRVLFQSNAMQKRLVEIM